MKIRYDRMSRKQRLVIFAGARPHIFLLLLLHHQVIQQCQQQISNLTEQTEQYGAIQRKDFTEAHKRKDLLLSLQPESIVYKRLLGYKQVLMHKNYTSFVPVHYHSDLLYRKPSKEVFDAEEVDQKKRQKYKKEHKKLKTVIKGEV